MNPTITSVTRLSNSSNATKFEVEISAILYHPATPTSSSIDSGIAGGATGLSLIFIVAFILNTILAVTLASSTVLRRSPFNLVVLSCACANLLECCLNMAAALVFIISARWWKLGLETCGVQASFAELIPAVWSLEVAHMLMDRVYAVTNAARYKRLLTPSRQSIIIVCAWATALILTWPPAFQTVESRPFQARLSCWPADPSQEEYNCIFPILTFAIPFFISCICVCFLTMILVRDYRLSQTSSSSDERHAQTIADPILRQPLLWTELQLSKLALVIFICYLLFHGPSLVNVQVDQALNSHQFPTFPIRGNNDTNSTNSTVTRREVVDSPDHDEAFAWIRFIGCCFLPIVVLLLKKEVRHKSRVLLTFWKDHPRSDLSPRPSAYYEKKPRPFSSFSTSSAVSRKFSKRRKSRKDMAHYSTPVLFATSEGLYLRVTEDPYRQTAPSTAGGIRFWGDSVSGSSLWGASAGSSQPGFVAQVCDVWESYDDIEDLEESDDEDGSADQVNATETLSASDNNGQLPLDPEDLLRQSLKSADVFSYRHQSANLANSRRMSSPGGSGTTTSTRQNSSYSFRRMSAALIGRRAEPADVDLPEDAELGQMPSPDVFSDADSGVGDAGSEREDGSASSARPPPFTDQRRRKSVRFSNSVTEIPQPPPVVPLQDRLVKSATILPPITIPPVVQRMLSPASTPSPSESKMYVKNRRVRPSGLGNGGHTVQSKVNRSKHRGKGYSRKPAWNAGTRVTEAWSPTPTIPVVTSHPNNLKRLQHRGSRPYRNRVSGISINEE